jgi:hypothetical protein
MKYGYYSDREIPKSIADSEQYRKQYKLNKQGYRCLEFSPLPDGGKNVVVLGCSHTFGEGLDDHEIWISQLEKLYYSQKNKSTLTNLRFWNLGHPGASPDTCVRILYGSEKVLYPKIIIVCWPVWSRRERLDSTIQLLTSNNNLLKQENEHTDRNNFLKCLFQIEKFANHTQAKTFHCFAENIYLHSATEQNILIDTSLKMCWPKWDRHHLKNATREIITDPDLARDGKHYGVKHHQTFAEILYNKFHKILK